MHPPIYNNKEQEEIGAAARRAVTQITQEAAMAVGMQATNPEMRRIQSMYVAVTGLSGGLRTLAQIIGYSDMDPAKDGEQEYADSLVTEASMLFASILLAKMCREVGDGTEVCYDVEILMDAFEATERAYGGSLEGKILPSIVKAVKETKEMGDNGAAMLNSLTASRSKSLN